MLENPSSRRTAYRLAFALILVAVFVSHRWMTMSIEFREGPFLTEWHSVATGAEPFPSVGRQLAESGFHTGPFEIYLMSLPFALGFGLPAMVAWLSLQWTLAAAITMAAMGAWFGRREALLSGLVYFNAFPYLVTVANFQNNSLVPMFAAAFFALVVDGIRLGKVGPGRMLLLGLVVGLLPQVHFGTVLLLPAAVAVWLWKRPSVSWKGWSIFAVAAVAPWIGYFRHEATSGWPNLRALFGSGLQSGIPEPATHRLVSWLSVFASVEGLVLLVVIVWLFSRLVRRRPIPRNLAHGVFAFAVVQITLPTLLYDFFSRVFLSVFIPAFPVAVALVPRLVEENMESMDADHARRWGKRLALGIGLATVLIPYYRIAESLFAPLKQRQPVRESSRLTTLFDVARHACELGLSSDVPWTDSHFQGPYLLMQNGTWEMLRMRADAKCATGGDNHILVLPENFYRVEPGDRVARRGDLIYVGHAPSIMGTELSFDEPRRLEADLVPPAKYLYVQVVSHEFLIDASFPEVALDGVAAREIDRCEWPASGRGFDKWQMRIYEIPNGESQDTMRLELRPPEGIDFENIALYARRTRMPCPYEPVAGGE
ncbi:MAG: hypothetical protein H6683_02890 [Deltaproteobacteria bacterium]|nr:hypothetical protein [Deltaproteobacteria bacterium]